jgi:hypothetical protein
LPPFVDIVVALMFGYELEQIVCPFLTFWLEFKEQLPLPHWFHGWAGGHE